MLKKGVHFLILLDLQPISKKCNYGTMDALSDFSHYAELAGDTNGSMYTDLTKQNSEAQHLSNSDRYTVCARDKGQLCRERYFGQYMNERFGE